MITEGLIAIGIIALIAALLLLTDKTKSRQSNKHIQHKRAANQYAIALAEPSGSAKTLTPFPPSTADQQFTTFIESSELAKTMASFSAPRTSFPISTVDKSLATLVEPLEVTETLTQFDLYTPENDAQNLAKPSQAIEEETPIQFDLYTPEDDAQNLAQSSQTTKETQASSPMQTTTVTQTPVQEIQPTQTQVRQVVPDQAQVPIALNEQPTAKLHNDLPERPAPSSLAFKIAPLPPSQPISRSFQRPPSIDEQMADLAADAWALQQQAAEIVRRLSYLSACLQASAPYEPDNNSNHNS